MKKFQGKYRIPSARALWWDYFEGSYFITICTRNRLHWFGSIQDKKMFLSPIGEIAEQCWVDIPNHCPYVQLGEYKIMPNHIHGIIDILPVQTIPVETLPLVETLHATSLQMGRISPKRGSLGRVLGSYKSAVSNKAHEIDGTFDWQERFHDHIIRDADEYHRIREYIIHNPENWEKDCFNN
jgi:putative transposase